MVLLYMEFCSLSGFSFKFMYFRGILGVGNFTFGRFRDFSGAGTHLQQGAGSFPPTRGYPRSAPSAPNRWAILGRYRPQIARTLSLARGVISYVRNGHPQNRKKTYAFSPPPRRRYCGYTYNGPPRTRPRNGSPTRCRSPWGKIMYIYRKNSTPPALCRYSM